jgi:hypothetical protein
MSLSDKFNELERLLRDEQRHALAMHTGVPFILLIYDPHKEKECRARQIHLREKLQMRGLEVVEIELTNFIFDYYEERGQLERIFELDRDADKRDELRRMIAGKYEKLLVDRVQERVEGLDRDRGVIFLTGVASMYPFARVSNLLTELENKVRVPLVVFYPGSELNGKLSFLNREPHIGYRAHRI